MDLLEVSALVSTITRVSPCRGCYVQHLHARGGLQDELDELWPIISFGDKSADGIGFSKVCHFKDLRSNLTVSLFWGKNVVALVSSSCVAWAVFVANIFFHRLWSIVSFNRQKASH